MSSHADLLTRWFNEVWNQGRTESVYELFAADGVMHGLGEPGRDARGPEGFLPFFREFRGNVSEVHFTIEDVLEVGEKAAVRWVAQLRPAGHPDHPIDVSGMSFVRIRDGQLVEGWNNWDALEFVNHVQGLGPTITLMPEN